MFAGKRDFRTVSAGARPQAPELAYADVVRDFGLLTKTMIVV
jgi:hypothetical protein